MPDANGSNDKMSSDQANATATRIRVRRAIRNDQRDVDRTRLGSNLRALREQRKLRQSELAKLAGVTQAMISRVERGERELPLSAVERLAQSLRVDPSTLIGERSSVEALESLHLAWDAYTAARKRYVDVATHVKDGGMFLQNHLSVLMPALKPDDRGQLRRIVDYLKDDVNIHDLVAAHEHEHFRHVPAGSLPDREQRLLFFSHLADCERLRPHEFALVRAVAACFVAGRPTAHFGSDQQ
jgi:transcriptional regulator with XRE-family HTH domain